MCIYDLFEACILPFPQNQNAQTTVTMASLSRLTAAALLLCHQQSAVVASDNASTDHTHASGIQDFIPPKLSFTAADYFASLQSDNVVNSVQHHPNDDEGGASSTTLPWSIFQGVPSTSNSDDEMKGAIERRSGPLLALFPDANAEHTKINKHKQAKHMVLTPAEQRSYLENHGKDCHSSDKQLLERYDLFVKSPTLSNLATELWKYCALYNEGGIYVDAETAPLAALGDVLSWDNHGTNSGKNGRKNYVVTADTHDAGVSPSLLHGDSISDSVTTASSLGSGKPIAISSLIAIATIKNSVPLKMIDALMDTEVKTLEENALLLPTTLMELIQKDTSTWGLLRQRCNGIQVAGGYGYDGQRTLRHCPTSSGYCCEVLDPKSNFVFLLSRQAMVPNQILPQSSTLPQPFNSESLEDANDAAGDNKDLPFISTVHEEITSPLLTKPFTPGSFETTPNAFELLNNLNALPTQEANKQQCMDCLREKKAADCTLCAIVCPNYCKNVCELELEDKPVKRVLSVDGPRYRKDPERLIPRIVHQVSLVLSPRKETRVDHVHIFYMVHVS